MKNPHGLTTVRTASYQHRAYLAENAAQAELEALDSLLGWKTLDELKLFHLPFALGWFTTGPPPTLVAGTGSRTSRYLPATHRIKLMKGDLHVLSYAHELGHAVECVATAGGKGTGHNPRWAGHYLDILTELDADAAKLLARHMRIMRLTIARS